MAARQFLWVPLAMVLCWGWLMLPHRVLNVSAAIDTRPREIAKSAPSLAEYPIRAAERQAPCLSNEAFIRPEFQRQMRELRPAILASAARHNRPAISGMSNHEFAVAIAAVLYNEHFGWFEEEVKPARSFTPLYQDLQIQANHIGANLSVWPANLRPSVAEEILRGHVPVPPPTNVITRSIVVAGSQIDPAAYPSKSELYRAITREIADPHLAVEYLAANLERGVDRASYEGVPLTWRTLAAWHNQGIVAPKEIAANATAFDYVRRASAYLPAARDLIDRELSCANSRCTLAQHLAEVASKLQ